MARYQKDDDYLKERGRGFAMQRNYEYDITEYNAETGEKHIPDDALTEDEWKKEILDLFYDIAESSLYAYLIFHDKDYLPNGNYKPLHVHIVIRFENPRRVGSLMKAMGISSLRNIDKVRSYQSALQYLLHITPQARKDGKHVYDQENLYMAGSELDKDMKYPHEHYDKIVANNKEDESVELEHQKKAIGVAKSCLVKLRDNGITLPQVYESVKDSVPGEYCHVATDVYYSYERKFKSAENDYFKEKVDQLKRNGRNLTVVYVHGPGLSGKSKLAEGLGYELEDGRGVHIAAAAGKDKTPDFASKYNHENVTVINEVRGSTFIPREFMDNFDNEIYAPIPSRNSDVDWTVDYLFLTSSRSPIDFRNECFRYNQGGSDLVDMNVETGETRIKREHEPMDEAFQFTRRITHHISISKLGKDKKAISVYCFDLEKKGYRLQKIITTKKLFDKDEKEFKRVKQEVLECFKNKSIDMYDGQVEQDDDLEQNKEDVYQYEAPPTENERMWEGIHKKHDNVELFDKYMKKRKQQNEDNGHDERPERNPFDV